MPSSRRQTGERRALAPPPGPSRKQKLMAWVLIVLMLSSVAGALVTYFAE